MSRPAPVVTGAELFVAQLDLIERIIAFVSTRHHVSVVDAEDFGSFVKLKLIENDYAVFAKFQQRSSLRTYLTVVIQRLLLDYRISAWGKWRPSAEAKRAGAVGVWLEQMMVRDGRPFDEACDLLRTEHRVTAARAELEAIAARLPQRVRRRFESEDALATVAATSRPTDEQAADRDREETARRLSEALEQMTSTLNPQDRLILALRFEDGRSVADIATMLRLEQKGLYRRIDRVLQGLRHALENQGIDRADVLEILESPAAGVQWSGHLATEKSRSRPSRRKEAPEWR